ncbi:alginate export family protein [Methylomonas rhizoryzae]|uniref:alginate export family protein n=1 Tax=Methylomonas rhizoryzae TaxID=2608981 RepID=UPI0012328C9F|nr:alginate export family protein [Methylomonas rhizoryzae]
MAIQPVGRASTALPLSLLSACTFLACEVVEAAEKPKYIRPPFAAFSSQMHDPLLGGGKYEKPVWNLHDMLKLPDWLSMSVEQRTRYETFDNAFKASGSGGDQQIALQTAFWLEANLGKLRAGAEFVDARALLSDKDSDLNTTHADNADFIQGYLNWAEQNLFYSGIGADATAGRQTLNIGSRRLVARNALRNTINSFTGVKLRVTDYSQWAFTGFVTMPVLRFPDKEKAILAETHEFDEEDTHTWFSGGFLELYDLLWGINAEAYLYHLDEGDSIRNPTRNRRYFTPGMRFYLKPAKAKLDFELEAIGQLGTVRKTTANSDGKDLDHAAWYEHVSLGYTLDVPWSPRFGLDYDYASGDEDPNDNLDQRFDTLYGARRFEFGPTGIYGAFARSNINTPGYGIGISPRSDVQMSVRHRYFWLASDTDSWTTAGLRDKTGKSGGDIGHQLELTARWDFNSSLNFEAAWAHLFKGAFAQHAPSAPAEGDVDYVYLQSQLRF